MNSNAKNSRLYEKLKEDILSGSCQPGFRFPAEIPYAKKLGVSRNTLRTALKWLEEENLIVRGRGKGTFVNPGCGYEKRRRYMLLLDAAPPAPYTEHIIPQIMLGIEHNEIMEMIRRRRISGILWKSSAFLGNEKVFLALKSLPVPVVLLYCQPEDYRVTGWAAIPQNTRNAWCEALRYLQGCGHTRIGIVNTDVPGLIRHEFNPEEYARILGSRRLPGIEEAALENSGRHCRHGILRHAEQRLYESASFHRCGRLPGNRKQRNQDSGRGGSVVLPRSPGTLPPAVQPRPLPHYRTAEHKPQTNG